MSNGYQPIAPEVKPEPPRGGSSGKNNEITIDVKTNGLDKLTQQMEALSDAMRNPQVVVRNCEHCEINIHPSQTVIITGPDESEE